MCSHFSFFASGKSSGVSETPTMASASTISFATSAPRAATILTLGAVTASSFNISGERLAITFFCCADIAQQTSSTESTRFLMGVEYPTRSPPLQMKRLPRTADRRSFLYEDEAVVAIDKPAGLPAVPVKGSDIPSALSLVSASLRAKRQRALVVHRIDRFTSGILLFAKTEVDRNKLVRQFLAHAPERHYLAIVRGRLAAAEGTLVHYFRKEGMLQKL